MSDEITEERPDRHAWKATTPSSKVRKLSGGLFRTTDGKRYAVNNKGEIRRTDRSDANTFVKP